MATKSSATKPNYGKKNKNDRKESTKRVLKKPYPFDTGLDPVGEWKRATPFLCGKCGHKEWPQKSYKGECSSCGYKILYKQRPRYEVWHKAR